MTHIRLAAVPVPGLEPSGSSTPGWSSTTAGFSTTAPRSSTTGTSAPPGPRRESPLHQPPLPLGHQPSLVPGHQPLWSLGSSNPFWSFLKLFQLLIVLAWWRPQDLMVMPQSSWSIPSHGGSWLGEVFEALLLPIGPGDHLLRLIRWSRLV